MSLKASSILRVKDLSLFYTVSIPTARLRLREIQKALNKDFISVFDVAKYEGYPVDFVIEMLT